MTANRNAAYAEALLGVARAEGRLADVESELSQVAVAIQGSEELRATLADPHVPMANRVDIVERVLGGRVSPVTHSLVALLVTNGRVADLGAIVEQFAEQAAGSRGEVLAEVRSAVALSDDQKKRLAAALKQQTKRDVTIRNVIDPTVVGGVVTQIGDTLLDGSVRTGLNQLREAF